MTSPYYPAFVELAGKRCVVVGGGKVAERKVLSLLRAGASVTVVSPILTAPLKRRKQQGDLEHRERNYRKGDLRKAFLVIAATSDEMVNRRVAEDAPCLVNVVDRPELANFIVPSLVQRGPLSVAISTSGTSPAMARTIKKELESLYPPATGSFLTFLGKLRKKALKKIKDRDIREGFLRWAGSAELIESLRNRGLKEAKTMIMERFRAESKGAS